MITKLTYNITITINNNTNKTKLTMNQTQTQIQKHPRGSRVRNLLFSLPEEILRIIYEYDDTNKVIYNRVLTELKSTDNWHFRYCKWIHILPTDVYNGIAEIISPFMNSINKPKITDLTKITYRMEKKWYWTSRGAVDTDTLNNNDNNNGDNYNYLHDNYYNNYNNDYIPVDKLFHFLGGAGYLFGKINGIEIYISYSTEDSDGIDENDNRWKIYVFSTYKLMYNLVLAELKDKMNKTKKYEDEAIYILRKHFILRDKY